MLFYFPRRLRTGAYNYSGQKSTLVESRSWSREHNSTDLLPYLDGCPPVAARLLIRVALLYGVKSRKGVIGPNAKKGARSISEWHSMSATANPQQSVFLIRRVLRSGVSILLRGSSL
jgi:hypothetical protein